MKKKTLIAINLIAFLSCFITSKSYSQDSIRLVNFERPAEYPEGQKALFDFIQSNLKIVKKGENCKNGNVYVNFCVNSDGSLSEIKIQKGLCPAYDAEVKRVFSIMKKWQPAIDLTTKKTVKSYYTIPVRINIE
jgi:periplasmic protein TonB